MTSVVGAKPGAIVPYVDLLRTRGFRAGFDDARSDLSRSGFFLSKSDGLFLYHQNIAEIKKNRFRTMALLYDLSGPLVGAYCKKVFSMIAEVLDNTMDTVCRRRPRYCPCEARLEYLLNTVEPALHRFELLETSVISGYRCVATYGQVPGTFKNVIMW